MIGESVPDQHKQAIAQLSAQIDHYLATGGRVLQVERGVSAEVTMTGMSANHAKLKVGRDRLAPTVRQHAEQGLTLTQIATATTLRKKRILVIARENNITIAGS
jgi:hypothetical protein